MSHWETTSTHEGAAAPADVWKKASGLRLRFEVVELEQGQLFTDEARLPGAQRRIFKLAGT
jgi:hypothetical protein